MLFSVSGDSIYNSSDTDTYNYGYEVQPNGQFHHEAHGPDGVTYGCYGYVDPLGRLMATFYVSDGWGYRVVHPGDNVEIFLHEHEIHDHSDNNSNETPHEHDHDHHGILTAWRDLHFPPICGEFEQTDNKPIVTGPPAPASKRYGNSVDQEYVKMLDKTRGHKCVK